ncbi:MAG TPA: nitronate monooxygenase [Jatrophihabitans sp.]|nr:nitronate monooxygenase [Jatrophihabitans sp.]
MILEERSLPIVLAPMAGGPSTPQLAAAVSNAGGLGFLAGGYLPTATLAERVRVTRELTGEAFGVNLFVPGPESPAEPVAQYAAAIRDDVAAAGAELGTPRYHDDDWAEKVALLAADPVPVVSFTFGLPPEDVVDRLHAAGSEVWITSTTAAEARAAAGRGADVLLLQGAEAGGHRGGLHDDPASEIGVLALLQLVAAELPVPLVAAGGIATGAAVAALLCAGASAAALGTAFLDCPEAGTSAVHRAALHREGTTALTRAFSGRTARGIRNAFLDRHSGEAPAGYPEIHYLTSPMRKAARERGNADAVNLWAGQAYPLTRSIPAAELVHSLADDMRTALERARARVDGAV